MRTHIFWPPAPRTPCRPIPGIKDNPNCIDSTGALSLKELPKSMVVIGGGVIGLELACAYAAFGTKVTVVEAMDHMLPMLDSDLTKVGVAHMKKWGSSFIWSALFSLWRLIRRAQRSCAGARTTRRSVSWRRRCWWLWDAMPTQDSLRLDAGGIKHGKGTHFGQ